MSKVLERRREFLQILRQFTLEKGFFTVTDLARSAGVPRSTAQDWIHRLLEENCIVERKVRRGRRAARYAAISALPKSTCRRIFTTVDGDEVEIYHECMSTGCAAFCEYHHRAAGGIISSVSRDGTLLRERAPLGEAPLSIGLYPRPAVGVVSVMEHTGWITQKIRCLGGPAYSVTDMMSLADGVKEIQVSRKEEIVEGEVTTRALLFVAIGLDDTDSREGGATFALAIALLQHISKLPGVFPIGHRVVMLNPALEGKTVGNSASLIELAVDGAACRHLVETVRRFVEDEALSDEWGIAIKQGFRVSERLRDFGAQARMRIVDRNEAQGIASSEGIILRGGRGVIGALAAVSFIGLESTVLLDPDVLPVRYAAD